MGMTASGGGRSKVARMGSPIPQIMDMICYGFDNIIGIRIKMFTSTLALISGSLNNMIHMGNYTNGNKRMSIIIEIYPPWIARALRKDLEFMSCWMISPYTCIQFCSLVFGSAGFAHIGMCKYPMYAVQPTIGPPSQVVKYLMRIIETPAIEQYLRRSGRLVIGLVNRNK